MIGTPRHMWRKWGIGGLFLVLPNFVYTAHSVVHPESLKSTTAKVMYALPKVPYAMAYTGAEAIFGDVSTRVHEPGPYRYAAAKAEPDGRYRMLAEQVLDDINRGTDPTPLYSFQHERLRHDLEAIAATTDGWDEAPAGARRARFEEAAKVKASYRLADVDDRKAMQAIESEIDSVERKMRYARVMNEIPQKSRNRGDGTNLAYLGLGTAWLLAHYYRHNMNRTHKK